MKRKEAVRAACAGVSKEVKLQAVSGRSAAFRKAYDEEVARLQIGYKLVHLRKQRKLTQGELARRVHTTQQTIPRIDFVPHELAA